MDRFTHVSALFDGLEITDEGAHLSPELLQALDDHLADQDIPNEPDAATLQRAQAAEGIVSQAAALLEPENDAAEVDVLDGIRNLLAENAALSAADGDDPTQIIKTADETDEEDPHAGFAHNRTADKLLI